MENAMTYGMESKLRLPSCFVEVTDDEMEYLDGGAWWNWLVVSIGVAVCVAAAFIPAGKMLTLKLGKTILKASVAQLVGVSGGALMAFGALSL